jgi:DNA-binding FrmR family transcriptional regulator
MLSISPTSAAGNSGAYQDLLQKQLDIAKKNAAAIDGLSLRADQDQKSLARQRVAEIKEQIEALRRMLQLFGGKDAKAVQQQLKQLATELKQAAGVLKTSPDTSVPDLPNTGDADQAGRDAYAEQQASADAEKVQISLAPVDSARAEDEKQIEAVTQALKSLRSMTDRLVKQQEHKV